MFRQALGWLVAMLVAIGLTGCFDGNGKQSKPPVITQQPANVSVTSGATATFNVTATGKSVSYQWQRGTTAIAGATSASYTTPATIAADDAATFRVVVTNKKGSVTSSSATLTVNVPPAITGQPAAATVTAGATATFSVTATGTRLTYQWQRGTTSIAGATSASYTTPATALGDNGATFRVLVANAAGTVTSSDATLTVTDPTPPSGGSTFRTTPMVSDFVDGGMALKADGTVWSWGYNREGQTGQGVFQVEALTPGQVQTASGPLTRIVKISAGKTFALALDADGHVWTWGRFDTLALQTPQTDTKIAFAQMVYDAAGGAPLANVVDVAAGDLVAAVVLADGRVMAWGNGAEGSTGQGTTTANQVAYPTVVPGVSGVVEVAASANVVHARTADGLVYQWGSTRSGQIAGSANTGTPTLAAGISSAVSIATSASSAAAILSDGTARIYGSTMWDGTTGAGDNCILRTLTPQTIPLPTATASTFTSINVIEGGGAQLVFGGQLYEVGPLLEDDLGSGWCTRKLDLVAGLGNIVGVATSWGQSTHVWTADGRVYGLGANNAFNLGVGNTNDGTGFRELVGFNLLGAAPTGTDVLFLDFESPVPDSVALGTATLTGVQNFAGLGPTGGTFTGSMLRSETGNIVTITLTNLPSHTSVNLAFLFAAIDSLDGAGSFPAGDYFKITVDGATIFREAFSNASTAQVQTYLSPPGVELARRVDLGFGGPGGFHTDSAYDMGADPQFQLIPHTASTLTLTFSIEGSGVQGLSDESWGIENLRISLNP